MTSTDTKTLAQLLGEERLSMAEAMRCAIQLAGCLRELHDRGQVHGAVTPANVALVASGLELLPASSGAITSYTAPEVVRGSAADARSDIFGFGAIVFEMFTGRRAFEGESRAALMAGITKSPTPSTGKAALDRVVGLCLNKDPDARASHMRRVVMELKLVSVPRRELNRQGGEEGFEALNARIGQIEHAVDEIRRHLAHFEHSVAADLVDIERSIKAQAASIESSRTAMSQTDDLVERVVEALESLETTVLDKGAGGKKSAPAVN
jgi:serine/threonine protein kinase